MSINQNNEELRFESLKIGLASTERILEWSYGEVTEPETINYRTFKPELNGLFCERIFGPEKSYVCHCGKHRNAKNKGVKKCEKCGVELVDSKVRRERMGHIELASPVSHIWYFKGVPSRMGLVLDMTPKNLEKVLYFANYIVLDPGESGFEYKDIITENEYIESRNAPGFRAGIGAEAIREVLANIDLEKSSAELREELENASGQKKTKIVRRLEVIEAFRLSKNRPEWMILEVIPVIPPDLRPMVQLDGGRFATSDLNDLYRRVINRNKRLNKLKDQMAPDIIIRNEKRMLQEAVDALIDNGRRGKPITGANNRAFKSLSDMLKGKQGRFRQNLLGKRVDYSGRSVIVVGPELRFWQCGLPKKMALELFKPFVMKKLVEKRDVANIKQAKKMVETMGDKVWDTLDEIIREHPVMLNRAPTLHRLGIQAFEPVLVEGKAIQLHPLVCTAFNADFDGDQMAVHLPLSVEAQAEARYLMLSVNNILAPKDGTPITTPTQDMILGAYYLTYISEKINVADLEDKDVKKFTDIEEMLMAYQEKIVGIRDIVEVRRFAGSDDKRGKRVRSSVGRFIFNEKIPQDLGFVKDRKKDPYSLEIEFLCNKKNLGKIIDRCYRVHGNTKTAIMLDAIKDIGFHYSTKGAITISVSDMKVPEEKKHIIEMADKLVDKYDKAYQDGLMTENERYNKVCKIWSDTTELVADALMKSLGEENNLYIMAQSGARGSRKQISQVGGMRGLMANATGKTIEIPIKANFREGLSVLEYFISTNGARKGLADTALRTADSGYLTRRLVDISHNVIVREEDCGTEEGIKVSAFREGNEEIESLKARIVGRIATADILNPTDETLICPKGHEITEEMADAIEEAGIETVGVKSVMTCKSRRGVCATCYGRNLATGEKVNIGEAVGITAAQSIGEPGTQLTMRTFHTGGVAGGDITQGLPRVEELFEARKPKGIAEICEEDGVVESISTNQNNEKEITVKGDNERIYTIPYGAKEIVEEGKEIKAGDGLTRGPLDPHDILRLKGEEGVYQYLLKEVQRVYKMQGVDINDKHIEVIASQMLSKYRVEDQGDTNLLPGGLYSRIEIDDANAEVESEGGRPAEARVQLLGITKASLATSSFLSAASFQETTRVLTDAAIKGKQDYLVGLKENVIIGNLIPAGTGMPIYRDVEVDYGERSEEMENWVPPIEDTQSKSSLYDDMKRSVDVTFDDSLLVGDEGLILEDDDYYDDDLLDFELDDEIDDFDDEISDDEELEHEDEEFDEESEREPDDEDLDIDMEVEDVIDEEIEK